MDNNCDLLDINRIITKDNTNEIKEQLKLFLLSRAQREAMKVDSLQTALEKFQQKYIEKSISYMEEHDDDTAIMYLPDMIKNVSQYLKDSGDTIKSVVSDNELFDKLCIGIQENNTINNVIVSEIDADSRRKIRNVVKEILQLASEENISNEDKKIVDNDSETNTN